MGKRVCLIFFISYSLSLDEAALTQIEDSALALITKKDLHILVLALKIKLGRKAEIVVFVNFETS